MEGWNYEGVRKRKRRKKRRNNERVEAEEE